MRQIFRKSVISSRKAKNVFGPGKMWQLKCANDAVFQEIRHNFIFHYFYRYI